MSSEKQGIGLWKEGMEIIPGDDKHDPFLRQRRNKEWNQEIIEKQIALVLGVGGLGSTIAQNLCRLGFKKFSLLIEIL